MEVQVELQDFSVTANLTETDTTVELVSLDVIVETKGD